MSELQRACDKLDVSDEQVVKHRIEGGELVLLVNYGIGGVKKYRVPLADLKPEPVNDAGLGEALAQFSYRELQQMAMAVGIPANQSADDLRAALTAEEEE